MNLYTYCENNPIMYVDPTGHFGIVSSIATGSAIYHAVKSTYKAVKKASRSSSRRSKRKHRSHSSHHSSSSHSGATIGAAIGTVIGGPVGGAIGATIGASAGTVADEIKKHHSSGGNSKDGIGGWAFYDQEIEIRKSLARRAGVEPDLDINPNDFITNEESKFLAKLNPEGWGNEQLETLKKALQYEIEDMVDIYDDIAKESLEEIGKKQFLKKGLGKTVAPLRVMKNIWKASTIEAGDYSEDDVKDIINEALRKRSDDIKNKAIVKPTGGRYNPTMTTVAYDKVSGKIYYGHSGKTGFNPTRLDKVHPELQNRMEQVMESAKNENKFNMHGNPSYKDWDIDNCGEFNAINQALYDEASISNILMKTVRTKNLKTELPCGNCKRLFYDASFVD